MDDVSRTLDVYESESTAYIEKYSAESAAATYGESFFDALSECTGSASVLNLGCGPGPDVETFVEAGYEVAGLDITQSFLTEATERVPAGAFVRGDMRSLPFQDGSFDGIWASASFHHVPRPDARETLRDCRRVLRPGGSLFASVKRDEGLDDDDTERHFEYYQPAAFRSLLEDAGFEPESVRTVDKWVSAVATN
jgi:ubiquinone/menaquinone biosynthesis C-methylase UbiE